MTIEIFPIGSKPTGKTIEAYLRRRLTGQSTGIALRRHPDASWSFSSLGKQEHTFAEPVPGQLEVSAEGAQLLRLNPRLLHRIRSGRVGEIAGEGNEASIHRQRYRTDHGFRWHAVKYTFPVRPDKAPENAPDYTRFTPGIAHYHAGRFVAAHSPRPVNVVSPVIATRDICVSPFVHNGIPLFILNEMTAGRINPRISAIHLTEKVRSFVEQMKSQEPYVRFIHLFTAFSALNHAGMAHWLERQIQQSPDAAALRSALQGLSFHTKEIETPRNTLVHIPSLRTVLRKWFPRTDRIALHPDQITAIDAYQKQLLAPNSAPVPTPDPSEVISIRDALSPQQHAFLQDVARASCTVEALLGYKLNGGK